MEGLACNMKGGIFGKKNLKALEYQGVIVNQQKPHPTSPSSKAGSPTGGRSDHVGWPHSLPTLPHDGAYTAGHSLFPDSFGHTDHHSPPSSGLLHRLRRY